MGSRTDALDVYWQAAAILASLPDPTKAAHELLEQAALMFDQCGDVHRNDQKEDDNRCEVNLQEIYSNAIRLAQKGKDPQQTADALSQLGRVEYAYGNQQKALEAFQQETEIRKQLDDVGPRAKALLWTGRAHLAMLNGLRAAESFQAALLLYQSAKDSEGQATVLHCLGLTYLLLKKNEQALDTFNREFLLTKPESAKIFTTVEKVQTNDLWDPELKAKMDQILAASQLTSMEALWDWFTFADLVGWDDEFEKLAKLVFRATHDTAALQRIEVANMLRWQSELSIAEANRKALQRQNDLLRQALAEKLGTPAKPVVDPRQEKKKQAEDFQNSGVFNSRRNSQKALADFQRALQLWRELDDQEGMAITLMGLGGVWFARNENAKALSVYQQALHIEHAAGNARKEAYALTSIGQIENWVGNRRQAIKEYEQALLLLQGTKETTTTTESPEEYVKRGFLNRLDNQVKEPEVLLLLGISYFQLGEKQKALAYLAQAQTSSRTDAHPNGASSVLSLIARVHDSLGEKQKAQEYYGQAVDEFRTEIEGRLISYNLRDKNALYNQLANVYDRLGRTQEAVNTLQRGLVFGKEFGSLSDQAYAFNRLGEIALRSNNPPERSAAVDYFQQALALRRQDGNRSSEAEALNNLATAYVALGNRDKALPLFHQALAIRHQLKEPDAEGETLNELMKLWRSRRQPSLAIFYGKQAVNAIQQIRLNIQGLDQDVQKSFLASHSDVYRELADLLITQGRLPEAQQVLDLLKRDEFLDFIRREGGKAPGKASLNPHEAEQLRLFEQIQNQVIADGERFATLNTKESLTEQDRQELSRLETKLSAANVAYEHYLDALPQQFASVEKGEFTASTLKREARC